MSSEWLVDLVREKMRINSNNFALFHVENATPEVKRRLLKSATPEFRRNSVPDLSRAGVLYQAHNPNLQSVWRIRSVPSTADDLVDIWVPPSALPSALPSDQQATNLDIRIHLSTGSKSPTKTERPFWELHLCNHGTVVPRIQCLNDEKATWQPLEPGQPTLISGHGRGFAFEVGMVKLLFKLGSPGNQPGDLMTTQLRRPSMGVIYDVVRRNEGIVDPWCPTGQWVYGSNGAIAVYRVRKERYGCSEADASKMHLDDVPPRPKFVYKHLKMSLEQSACSKENLMKVAGIGKGKYTIRYNGWCPLSRLLIRKFIDEDPISHEHFNNSSEVFVLAEHMCNALVHLDSKSVIHGNIKPSTIFRVEKKKEIIYKLADFGLAGPHDPLVKWNSYTAPEIRDAMEKRQDPTQHYTAEADIWSLGIVLLEMVVKSKPSTWGQTDGSDTEDEDTTENFSKHVAKKLHEVKLMDTQLHSLLSNMLQPTGRSSAQQLAAIAKKEVAKEKSKRAEEKEEKKKRAAEKRTPAAEKKKLDKKLAKKKKLAEKKLAEGQSLAGQQRLPDGRRLAEGTETERESSISTTDEDTQKSQDQQHQDQMVSASPTNQPGPDDWDMETEVGSEDVEAMDVDMIDEIDDLKLQQYQTWVDAWFKDGEPRPESYEHEMEPEYDNFEMEDVEMMGGDANYPRW